MSRLFNFVALICALCSHAFGQCTQVNTATYGGGYTRIESFTGATYAMASRGPYLDKITISAGGTPTLASTTNLTTMIDDFVMVGSIAIVSRGTSLGTYDCSTTPPTARFGALSGVRNQRLVVSGNRLYALTYAVQATVSLRVYDISLVEQPDLLGTVNLSSQGMLSVQAIAASGTTLYVAGIRKISDVANTGIYVFNISNLASPQLIGINQTVGLNYSEYHDLLLNGTALYLARDPSSSSSKIETYNVSSPTPALSATINILSNGRPSRLRLLGNLLHVSVGREDLQDSGFRGIALFSVTTPTAPSALGTLALPGRALDLHPNTNRAYVAGADGGVQVVSTSPAASPTLLGTYGANVGDVTDITINTNGTRAYIANGHSGASLLNITTPSSPSVLSTIPGTYVNQVMPDAGGNTLFVLDNSQGLKAYSIVNPVVPTLLSTFDPVDLEYYGMAGVGTSRTVLTQYQRIVVADTSNPSAPVLRSLIVTEDYCFDAEMYQNHAYIANSYRGLIVYDLTTPTAPVYRGTFGTGTGGLQARHLARSGTKLAVVSESLFLYDLTSPSSPQLARIFAAPLGSNFNDCWFSGDILYVVERLGATDTYRVMGIDVGDIENPVQVFTLTPTTNARLSSVAVTPTHVLMGQTESGLRITEKLAAWTPVFRAPIGSQTTCHYGSVTLDGNVAASVLNTTYQWKYNGVNVVNGPGPGGATYAGATTPQLTIDRVTDLIDGSYQLVATSPCGSANSTGSVSLSQCDCIDFNADGVFPDLQDFVDFLFVYGGGSCPNPSCGDLDFNNDGVFPDSFDIAVFIEVFGSGGCSL